MNEQHDQVFGSSHTSQVDLNQRSVDFQSFGNITDAIVAKSITYGVSMTVNKISVTNNTYD